MTHTHVVPKPFGEDKSIKAFQTRLNFSEPHRRSARAAIESHENPSEGKAGNLQLSSNNMNGHKAILWTCDRVGTNRFFFLHLSKTYYSGIKKDLNLDFFFIFFVVNLVIISSLNYP